MKGRILLSIISFALIFCSFYTVITQQSAAAIDIFSQCSQGGQNQADSQAYDCQDCSSGAQNTDVCKEIESQQHANTNPIVNDIKVAIDILSIVIGIASIIVIIVGAFTMITHGGDPKGVQQARATILYALIGIVIAILAEAFVAFVLDKL